MNFTATAATNQKSIVLVTDLATVNADYPVLEIYINNTLFGTLVVGGSVTVTNGTTYTTTSGMSNLLFTVLGSDMTFSITTSVLGLTTPPAADDILNTGIYQFKLIPQDDSVNSEQYAGEAITHEIMCCITDKLSDLYCGNSTCNKGDVLKSVSNINGAITGARYSALQLKFDDAICLYNVASSLCGSDCGCGCS